MKQIAFKTVLAYLALALSFLPASVAVFGVLFLSLDQIDENLYTPADALKIGALTTGSAVVAYVLIRSAARHFSRPPHAHKTA